METLADCIIQGPLPKRGGAITAAARLLAGAETASVAGAETTSVAGAGTASIADAETASIAGAGTASIAGAGTASIAGAGTASIAGAGTASIAGAETASVAGAGTASITGGARPKKQNSAAALAGLTTSTGECAEGIDRKPGEPCSSASVINAVSDFIDEFGTEVVAAAANTPTLPSADIPATEIVREAATVLHCDSESCVLTHPNFRQYVNETGALPQGALEKELDLRFKASGPRNSKALANNFNLDETLQRWARVYTRFYPCPFAMMDFERNGDVLGRINIAEVMKGNIPLSLGPSAGIVRRPCDTFGCILNTDVLSGPGKHWVAVFVDCRGPGAWTVEYFNSAGNPPPKAVMRWMEKTRANLKPLAAPAAVETIAVTDVDHQEGQTECGLYSLYYIRRRLDKTPYTFFFSQIVPDEAMTEFRTHVFRAT